MKTDKILLAIEECKRFIERAELCVEARSNPHRIGEYIFYDSAPKESGAARRASMDLTRMLAEMRKP